MTDEEVRRMTMVHPAPGTTGDRADGSLAADLADLRLVLADQSFPARQDDLIAACLGRGTPSRLCCRLAKLSREAVYDDLGQVLADVEAAALATG
ncbi:hypothetical protein [Phycicoccus flavus]|uniref:Uncharacterized protein n=1 Tax=Phycicoccus flavus TaxID=2502783 RepID=A0A8T6R680_9MICO|nr:hypothetical protein [Phycicoccus flavus]NHA69144.1 hypothetical protein [Phycicoccus flavus]